MKTDRKMSGIPKAEPDEVVSSSTLNACGVVVL